MRSWGAHAVDRRPLGIPAYRRLWVASVISAVGGSFSLIAIPTQLFTLTGSSATVGAAAAVSFGALVVASLWAGAVADVTDRRRLLLAAHCGLALTYLALWAQVALGVRWVAVLLVLVACQGLSFGAVMATMGATVPRVVPADLLPAANSLSSLARYTGSIAGPLLAGVLIPVVGLGTLYLFDALALLAVVWAVFKLPPILPKPPVVPSRGAPDPASGQPSDRIAVQPGRPGSTPGQVLEGFRYLVARRVLVAVLAVDLAAMVFGMPVALFPELAERAYGGPAGGGPELGLLYAAYPAGVFAAGLVSGTFTRARRHGALMASAAAAWGVTVVLLGLAPRLWLALVALVLGGGANFVLSTFRNTITQAYTDDSLRGRIQGSLTVVLIGGPQTANLLHGIAGAAFGPGWTICVGGLLTVAIVAMIVRAVPELWHYALPAPAARAPPPPHAPDGWRGATATSVEPVVLATLYCDARAPCYGFDSRRVSLRGDPAARAGSGPAGGWQGGREVSWARRCANSGRSACTASSARRTRTSPGPRCGGSTSSSWRSTSGSARSSLAGAVPLQQRALGQEGAEVDRRRLVERERGDRRAGDRRQQHPVAEVPGRYQQPLESRYRPEERLPGRRARPQPTPGVVEAGRGELGDERHRGPGQRRHPAQGGSAIVDALLLGSPDHDAPVAFRDQVKPLAVPHVGPDRHRPGVRDQQLALDRKDR
jgi:MFS family permease